jgi:hypothetical protein
MRFSSLLKIERAMEQIPRLFQKKLVERLSREIGLNGMIVHRRVDHPGAAGNGVFVPPPTVFFPHPSIKSVFSLSLLFDCQFGEADQQACASRPSFLPRYSNDRFFFVPMSYISYRRATFPPKYGYQGHSGKKMDEHECIFSMG